MSNTLVSHATELPTIASAFESQDMMDVKADLELLREVPLAVGAAVRVLTERLCADYPINPEVTEALQRVYEALQPVVEACDEAAVVFASSHEADIARRLQPRVNEQRWNVH